MPSLADIFKEALEESVRADQSEKQISPSLDIEARVLRDLMPLVTSPCRFQVGDLVIQRQNHKAYKMPSLGIVTAILDKPFFDHEASAHEVRNDMVILLRDKEDNVLELIVQSWRFDKYDGPVA